MFAVYSNTTAPASNAYMNAVYGSNGFPMMGTFGVDKFVTARSVVANTGALLGTDRVAWATRISGSGHDLAYGVATDLSNNILVSGRYGTLTSTAFAAIGSNLTLAQQNIDNTYLIKYSPLGTPLWVATMYTSTFSHGFAVATDSSGNVFMTGNYASAPTFYNPDRSSTITLPFLSSTDIFVAKYSSAGIVQWAAQITGGGGDHGYGVATDSGGNVLVTGTSAGPIFYNSSGVSNVSLTAAGGTGDAFLAKYSSTGNVVWAARIGSTGNDVGYAVTTDTSDNVLVTGFYGGAMTLCNAGGTTPIVTFPASTGCFVIKYSSAGAVLWASRIVGGATSVAGQGGAFGIDVDTSGSVFVTGPYTAAATFFNASGISNASFPAPSGTDTFVAKYSSGGAVLWVAQIAGNSTDISHGLATDPSGDVFVTGTYISTGLTLFNTGGTIGATLPSGSFYFIAKYSSAGLVRWAAQIAGYPGFTFPPKGGCTADTAGNVTVVGSYATSATPYNSVGVAGATLGNSGSNDVFIVKYHSSGNFGSTFSMSSNTLISATYTPSTFSSFINGTGQTTLAGTTLDTIGLFLGGPSNYFSGSISEVLVFGTTLTAAQRQSVEGYLSRKWGIGTGLISTHPFYTIPPFNRYFNPTDVPGCSLWLDAADPTSVSPTALYTADAGIVATLAGSGTGQFADGTGALASFNTPVGVAVLPNGNIVVADQTNNRIRLITPGGVVTTLAGQTTAGSADGTGAAASFRSPRGVAVLPNGNIVVADYDGARIRIVTQAGVVTTLAGSTSGYADGTGAAALFRSPWGVAVLPNSNIIVSDVINSRIRMVTPGGVVTTIAGTGTFTFADGTGAAAGFNQPQGVAVLPDSNIVLADLGNHRIRLITLAGVVTTLAGSGGAGFADGVGAAASFNQPQGIAVISSGLIVVTDAAGSRIRLVTYPGGVVTTLAGSGALSFANGMGSAAIFNRPAGVAVLSNGTLVVADQNNHRIRLISGGGVTWNDKSGLNNTMVGTATWTGSNMTFDGSTLFSNRTYVFPISNYSMFGVYSNTVAPAAGAYMNVIYGSNGFPMLGTFDVNRFVSTRSVVANTGELRLPSPIGWATRMSSTGTDFGNAVTVDPSGNLLIGGFFGFGAGGSILSVYNQNRSLGATLSGPAGYSSFVATFTPAGSFVSALQFSSVTGTVYVNSLTTDSSGNIYACGSYAGETILYNRNGTVGATLAVGGYNSWIFFAKYSAAGTVVWAARGASINQIDALSIAPDTVGNVFVGGTAGNQTAFFNANGTNANANNLSSGGGFLVRYSPTGVFIWGAKMNSEVRSVVIDSGGNPVVTGYGAPFTQIFVNSDGTTAKQYSTATQSNAWIAKFLGATGFLTWAARIGSNTNTRGFGITIDSSGDILSTGTSGNGTLLFFNANDTIGLTKTTFGTVSYVVKYSSAGVANWAATNSNGTTIGSAITADSSGNVMIAGRTNAASTTTFLNANGTASSQAFATEGSNDGFVAKYTSAGAVLWAARAGGGTGDDFAAGIATDLSGNVYVTGTYISAPLNLYNTGGTLGATIVREAAGTSDIFLAKYSPDGFITNVLNPPAASSNVLVSATYTPSTFSPFVNGSNAFTLAGTTLATTGIFVGGPSNYFNGTISELLIYSSNLSAAQRQQVEGYLIDKWSLRAQTVAGHQYKLIPPAASQPAQYSEVTQGNWVRDWQPDLQSLATANASGVTLTGSHITGGATYVANGWFGSVLGPDGNIYFVPFAAANILRLNVATGVTTNITGGATYTASGWRGGVLGPDGNIYFTPFAATNILRLNVATGVTTNITGGATYTANGWMGGALGPDGNIYFMPFAAANILRLNVATGVTTNITGGATYTASGWAGTILGPDGNIYGTPYNATNILRLNVATGVTTNITGGATYTTSGWQGQTLGQDGNIYFAPTLATNVLRFNVATGVTTNITGGATLSANATRQNVLGPDGNIYFTPHVGSFILRLNVSTGVISSLTPSGITYNGSGGWQGSILGPDGNIYFSPWAASNILKLTFSGLSRLPSSNYCLTPYANKY